MSTLFELQRVSKYLAAYWTQESWVGRVNSCDLKIRSLGTVQASQGDGGLVNGIKAFHPTQWSIAGGGAAAGYGGRKAERPLL